jgi:phosphoribosylformylglycinamidine synthase
VLSRTFRSPGHDIVLFGEGFGELGGSEYLKVVWGKVQGEPPRLDLERERALVTLLTRAAAAGLLLSAHDCSDGGIAITLAECSFETGIGLEVDIPAAVVPEAVGAGVAAATLFGESASRAVVSVQPDNRAALLQMAAEIGVPALAIGRTGGSGIRMAVAGELAIDCPLAQAEEAWSSAIEGRLTARFASR